MRFEAGAGVRPRASIMIGASLLFWSVFAVVQAVHTYLSMLTHGHSLLRLIVYEWLVFLFWVAATPLVAFLTRRFSLVPWHWPSAVLHTASAIVLTSVHTLWFVAMRIAVRPYDALTPTDFIAGVRQLYSAIFPLNMLVYVATLGAIHAFYYHERSRERAVRAADLERELARVRLDALAAQLQPHFLFNALHTVSGLIRGREYAAAISTVAGLSDLLRYALDASGNQEVRVADEIEATRHYLAIQQIRHRDRMTVKLDVSPETLDAKMPRLLLQPLVENAIRHGVAPAPGAAWLLVQAARRDGSLHLEIANSTCDGSPPGQGLGIGLRNTRERLDRHYGDGYGLQLRQQPDRFEVVLDLPWRTEGIGALRA